MAACRSLYHGNLRFSARICQYSRESNGLKGILQEFVAFLIVYLLRHFGSFKSLA